MASKSEAIVSEKISSSDAVTQTLKAELPKPSKFERAVREYSQEKNALLSRLEDLGQPPVAPAEVYAGKRLAEVKEKVEDIISLQERERWLALYVNEHPDFKKFTMIPQQPEVSFMFGLAASLSAPQEPQLEEVVDENCLILTSERLLMIKDGKLKCTVKLTELSQMEYFELTDQDVAGILASQKPAKKSVLKAFLFGTLGVETFELYSPDAARYFKAAANYYAERERLMKSIQSIDDVMAAHQQLALERHNLERWTTMTKNLATALFLDSRRTSDINVFLKSLVATAEKDERLRKYVTDISVKELKLPETSDDMLSLRMRSRILPVSETENCHFSWEADSSRPLEAKESFFTTKEAQSWDSDSLDWDWPEDEVSSIIEESQNQGKTETGHTVTSSESSTEEVASSREIAKEGILPTASSSSSDGPSNPKSTASDLFTPPTFEEARDVYDFDIKWHPKSCEIELDIKGKKLISFELKLRIYNISIEGILSFRAGVQKNRLEELGFSFAEVPHFSFDISSKVIAGGLELPFQSTIERFIGNRFKNVVIEFLKNSWVNPNWFYATPFKDEQSNPLAELAMLNARWKAFSHFPFPYEDYSIPKPPTLFPGPSFPANKSSPSKIDGHMALQYAVLLKENERYLAMIKSTAEQERRSLEMLLRKYVDSYPEAEDVEAIRQYFDGSLGEGELLDNMEKPEVENQSGKGENRTPTKKSTKGMIANVAASFAETEPIAKHIATAEKMQREE